jgi:hypothetical protein
MDLLHAAPEDEVHLAFSVDRETFDAVLARIREHNIAFGTHRGAGALYFYDQMVTTLSFASTPKASGRSHEPH